MLSNSKKSNQAIPSIPFLACGSPNTLFRRVISLTLFSLQESAIDVILLSFCFFPVINRRRCPLTTVSPPIATPGAGARYRPSRHSASAVPDSRRRTKHIPTAPMRSARLSCIDSAISRRCA